MVTAVIKTGRSPLLVNGTDCGGLVVLTSWPAKVRRPDVGVICIAWPVPEKVTAGGAGEALLVSNKLAVLAPLATGLKVTLMVQLAPPGSEVPQLLVWLKSDGPMLVNARLPMESTPVPELVMVTACAILVVPTN